MLLRSLDIGIIGLFNIPFKKPIKENSANV